MWLQRKLLTVNPLKCKHELLFVLRYCLARQQILKLYGHPQIRPQIEVMKTSSITRLLPGWLKAACLKP
jgi:hypothetical protein